MTHLLIGTRGSKLALAQTTWVADALRAAHPGLDIETRVIGTRGDATQAANVPLSSFGEKGIFAKELETALLAGEIDLAVHSMKDLEHTLPDGLVIAAVPPREDPRDALVGSTLDALPPVRTGRAPAASAAAHCCCPAAPTYSFRRYAATLTPASASGAKDSTTPSASPSQASIVWACRKISPRY